MTRSVSMLCLAAALTLPATASFARGSSGSHHAPVPSGALAMRPDLPGTNSSGTALSTSGAGSVNYDVTLGIDPAIAREDAAVDRLIKGSICRGC